jgi:RNA polymerase sigma-70 factor (family 1)
MHKTAFASDKGLLAAFHKGSNTALGQIFNLYYKPLVFFANKIINDLPEAEDITAESFYYLYTHRHDFHSLPKIKAFLYMANRNSCLNWLKAQRRHHASHQEIAYLSASTEEPNTSFINKNLYPDIIHNAQQLPEKCRSIFELIFYDGKKTDEVAHILGISTKNVTNQKLKAIKFLRQSLLNKDLLPLVFILICAGNN